MSTSYPARFAVVALAATAVTVPTPAQAEPLPYGPDTCIQGYVWREARSGDTVCVTPETRSTVAQQNADPKAHKDPNGAYGPESCAQGYVWREAFDGDTICVTPDFRQRMFDDNAAASSRKQANAPKPTSQAGGDSTVLFEITGSGTVYSIDVDPGGRKATENTQVPWKTTATVGPDVDLLQVVAVGKTGEQGCRITLDNEVVAEEPIGGGAHCVFNRP